MNQCQPSFVSRREFLQHAGGGLGGVALASMIAREAKAKAVIQIFCPGGLSHVDMWDYKPELSRRAG